MNGRSASPCRTGHLELEKDRCRNQATIMSLTRQIEQDFSWEAAVLPLNYTRARSGIGTETDSPQIGEIGGIRGAPPPSNWI
jgi:hypothetical protein